MAQTKVPLLKRRLIEIETQQLFPLSGKVITHSDRFERKDYERIFKGR